MKVYRGDVILLDYLFSNGRGSKIRPALVVQADTRNAKLTETIIALITKNLRYIGQDATQLFIDITTPDGQASGLNINSAAKCGKLYTIHEDDVRQKIGILSAALMQQIDDCLKNALDLK